MGHVMGKVQVFYNATLVRGYSPWNNQSHYFNYDTGMVVPCANPKYDVVMFLKGHDTHYFQHFLDNGIPHISLMEMATGIDPSEVTFVINAWQSEVIPFLLRRQGFKAAIAWQRSSDQEISAKRIVLAQVVPVVHPIFIHRFLDRLQLNHSVQDRIVLVSRVAADGCKGERVMKNQRDLEAALAARFGDQFAVFRPLVMGIAQAVALFQRAALVIGSHGGAMYNALWASRNCKIVEILPLRDNGAYPDQTEPNRPGMFAHLAFHTTSMMNFQRYYRYYSMSATINYDIDVGKFMKWLEKVYP
jgi:hypothetical protein